MKTLRLEFMVIILTALLDRHASIAAPQQPPNPQASDATKEQVSPEEATRRNDWSRSMLLRPLPRKGCFLTDYPNTEWRQVTCAPKRTLSVSCRIHVGSSPIGTNPALNLPN